MTPAQWDATAVMFERADKPTGAVVAATGRTLVFDGFLGGGAGSRRPTSKTLLDARRRASAFGTFSDRAAAEVPEPAAALHRGVAGQDARGRGHRPTVDLRVDHLGHPGAQVRRAARPPLLRHRPRRGRDRQAGRGVQGPDGRRLHAGDGGPARRDRGQGRRLAEDARALLRRLPPLARHRQRHDDARQGRGAADDLQVPEVRVADLLPVRQERPLPVLHDLPRVRLRGADHPRRPAAPAGARRHGLPDDGSDMELRNSRFGRFLASVNFPHTKFVINLDKKEGVKLPTPPALRSTCRARSAARRSTCAWASAARGSAARSSPSAAAAWPGRPSTRRSEAALSGQLSAHEKAHPLVVLKRSDGRVIAEGTPVARLLIPGGLAELGIRPGRARRPRPQATTSSATVVAAPAAALGSARQWNRAPRARWRTPER